MTVEYDPQTDLCPLCGAYWQHDFEACAKEHGFTVDTSQLNRIQMPPKALSVIIQEYRLMSEAMGVSRSVVDKSRETP